MRKIVIVTDAWKPQVNGVVTTYTETIKILRKEGYSVEIIEPSQFKSVKCPIYKEIPLSYNTGNFLKQFKQEKDIAFHIATEGPLGLKAKIIMDRYGWKYTTSFCTMFPDYLKKYLYVPNSITWAYLRFFHRNSSGIMVSTRSMINILRENGFRKRFTLLKWPRGVDTDIFYPAKNSERKSFKVALYVGRISYEKNLEDFLSLDIPDFTKVLVGDGPAREDLEKKYKDAMFVGNINQKSVLRLFYRSADVFVFPSKSDTFGLVMLEALACGTPIAAYPVQGPADIIEPVNIKCGILDNDLKYAIEKAYKCGDRDSCVKLAKKFDWYSCTNSFISNLQFVST